MTAKRPTTTTRQHASMSEPAKRKAPERVVQPATADDKGRDWGWQVYAYANTPKEEWIGFFETATTAVHWIMSKPMAEQHKYQMSMTKPITSADYKTAADTTPAPVRRTQPGPRVSGPPVARKVKPMTAAERRLRDEAQDTVDKNRADEAADLSKN